jgi:outer membrane protein W
VSHTVIEHNISLRKVKMSSKRQKAWQMSPKLQKKYHSKEEEK